MEAVFIYKDESKAIEELAFLAKVVVYLQAIHDELAAHEITPTLDELVTIGTFNANWSLEAKLKSVKDYVVTYLLTKAGEPNFNGVKISRNKLMELLEIPDLTNLGQIIGGYETWREPGFGIETVLLKLDGGVVSYSVNAETLIDDRNTYYSKNDAGAELATSLFEIAETINNHVVSFGNAFKIDKYKMPKGLEEYNGVLRPHLSTIREYEESRSGYIAV